MYEREEEKLKHLYENIHVPLDSLDEAIFKGFNKAKAEKRQTLSKKKWLFTMAAAAVIFIGFFTTIRLSPAFADYISVIPGMEKVVDLIRTDKGKMAAIENDYYEKLGVFQEKNGFTLTIDGAIADEEGLALFYTIKSKEPQRQLALHDVDLEGVDGKNVYIGTVMMGGALYSDNGESTYSDMLEFHFQNPLETKNFSIQATVKGEDSEEEFTLNFKLTKERQAKKTYVLNKTVTIEGQRILVEKADIYPLRAAVHVKMDPNNTKRVFSFDDIRLVDEHGEAWNAINNGVTASHISPDEMIIYLQSNYFREPKGLYLIMNKVQAVDKNETNVVVDASTLQILKQPKGNFLSDVRIGNISGDPAEEGKDLIFKFRPNEEFHSFLFSKITDGEGSEILSGSSFMSGPMEDGTYEIGVHISDLENLTNPVTLELTSFPSWIKGEGKIRIK